ncbi:hypothetical protein Dxin01_02447 [Deinococcus xinjiangensis]|uniref:Uncharacterized protein n=2 Tax=Deinococcus xinjiangensis TaxID=457454 RepID=A0ABP9VH92_9DEIO
MPTRLHRVLLGAMTLPAVQDIIFAQVHVNPPAVNTLRLHLSSPGHWRTGQIYGRIANDTLTITHAAIGGYPVWRPLALTGTGAYQLGFLDALRAEGHTDIDWVGHWMLRPDNQRPTLAESAAWLRYGERRGLMDAQQVLLSAGLEDHHLSVDAYHLIDDRMELLPTSLG